MKTFLIGLFALINLTSSAQLMKNPSDIVTQLFVSTDQKNWDALSQCFAATVELDYSSMTGNPAANLSPADIIEAWKSVLPGFTHTHHQIGNFIVTDKGDYTHVFCYGTATHYLENEGGNIWKVVGSYDFKVAKDEDQNWEVESMKFNFKYQDGNTGLPQVAMEKVKSNQ